MKKIVISLISVMLMSCFSCGSSTEELMTMADSCYNVENYEEAFKFYKKAANKDYAKACNALGRMYYYGYGVEENTEEAIKMLKKSVDLGDTIAYTLLGGVYENIDINKALDYYKKGASLKNASAMISLADLYYEGKYVQQNLSKSIEWYEKAADLNDGRAQFKVAYMYHMGEGYDKNMQKAIEWYEKAAKNGEVSSYYNMGRIYYWGLGVKKNYLKACANFEKVIELGSGSENKIDQSLLFIGAMYQEGGYGIKQDKSKGINSLKEGANQGLPKCEYGLGVAYYNGDGVEKDRNVAYNWIKKSANHGDSLSKDAIRDWNQITRMDYFQYWYR